MSVTRRYSEFVSLWDVLLRRYPFRLFPALPPKRIGGEFKNVINYRILIYTFKRMTNLSNRDGAVTRLRN